MATRPARPPWVLLTFSLPTKKASERVEIWRRVQRTGALAIGNAGYLLPNDAANREKCEWLASTIRKYQGEASVLRVDSINSLSFGQLAERFNENRLPDYKALIHDLQKYIATAPDRRLNLQALRLRSRFDAILSIDFFDCPLRRRAAQLLERMEERTESRADSDAPPIRIRDYRRTTWVTRPRPGVDRCGSAWLIRRFIDERARFVFADEDHKPLGAVAFDMYKDGFGHRGDDCTFETLVKMFKIRDSRVQVMGQIVHDADLFDDKFNRNEGYGIDAVLKGWGRQTELSDKELMDRGISLFEGLYRSLK